MRKQKILTLGSLFDGIGGFPYAGSFFGIKPLWASEILPHAISVTSRHFPNMEHVGDITALKGDELPPVDIITFGSPCQGLSLAGLRLGLADERSGLFSEAIRIIDEMRRATNGKYPRYAIWENVLGALSSGTPHGSDFKAVLEAFTKTEIPIPRSGKWANAGMVRSGSIDLAWCVYNAQYFGVPQRRRRIFLVCDFGGRSSGEILFIPKSLSGYFEACEKQRQEVAADIKGSVGSSSISANTNDIAATLFAGYGSRWNGNAGAYDGGNFALTKKESITSCEILNDQGGNHISVEKSELSPTLRSEVHGNLPIVSLEKVYPINLQLSTRHKALGEGTGFGLAEDGEPAYTLQKSHSHAVAFGVHQSPDGYLTTANSAYTLTTSGGSTSRNAPLICSNIHAFSFDSEGSNSMKSANPESGCRKVETAKTIDTSNPCPSKKQGGIAIVEVHPNITGTLCASGSGLSRPGGMASETDLCVAMTLGESNENCGEAYCLQGSIIGRKDKNGPNGSGVMVEKSFTLTTADTPAVASIDCRSGRETEELSATIQTKSSLNFINPIRSGYIVRRLLPIECERLQGYPDGWTECGEDSKAICDTNRYQMLGNSVAVPCVAYILMGVAEIMQKGGI